jgi:hypothetical protein
MVDAGAVVEAVLATGWVAVVGAAGATGLVDAGERGKAMLKLRKLKERFLGGGAENGYLGSIRWSSGEELLTKFSRRNSSVGIGNWTS